MEDSDQLRTIEHERLRALVRGDIKQAREVHAEDFQLINPAGEALSKEEYLGLISSGEFRYALWEPEPIAVRVHDTAATLRYRATIEPVFQGRNAGPGQYWHTDLYERRDGRWQVVWSQATAIR
jgi:hypothetical protein